VGKQVPLVMYNDGVRTVIGTADVEDDGVVHCTVDAPFDKKIFGTYFEDLEVSVSIMTMPGVDKMKKRELPRKKMNEEFIEDTPLPTREILYRKWMNDPPTNELLDLPEKLPFDLNIGEPNGQ
jgi:hypothetical protein